MYMLKVATVNILKELRGNIPVLVNGTQQIQLHD